MNKQTNDQGLHVSPPFGKQRVGRCFTSTCNDCKWTGSHYKLLNTFNGFFCPKCNSEDVIIFGKKQFKTPETIAKEFADWVRHALTNVEFCEKTIDEHYAFFISKWGQK